MGEMAVPAAALYGASTQRAVLNFPISGWRFSRIFLKALGLVKWAAARANGDLGRLTREQTQALCAAAEELIDGRLDAHFPVDIFQTGSGTSTNMNANEVLANRAAQLAGKPIGSRDPLHPNDHANLGQSSNDVIPTAMQIAAALALREDLAPALERLHKALHERARDFQDILKIGRTHLMDATPVRLGQVFDGYAAQAQNAALRCNAAIQALEELPLGGTAVGTGLNTHKDFARRAIAFVSERTGITFVEAENHFEAQSARDAIVEAMGLVKTAAIGLHKIANDIRWLGSGPRCGIGEISLPPTQPGSSIMPGKVNPVMSESLMQVCAQVVGADAAVSWAAASGSTFELNVMTPVMTWNLLESIRLLAAAASVFQEKCVEGISANRARCEELIELSLAMVTSLAPKIGYDRAAAIAKKSVETGRTVREICCEEQVLPESELEAALNPSAMTMPDET